MTMNKVINVVLLAAAIWFGWKYVVPWFKSLGGGASSRSYVDAGSGEDSRCVEAAREAAQVFSDELRSFSQPPIDANDWDRAYLRIENRIMAADDKCTCIRPGCVTARSALGDLRNLGHDFSNAARGAGAPPVNAGSSMSRIYDTLDTAANQARERNFN